MTTAFVVCAVLAFISAVAALFQSALYGAPNSSNSVRLREVAEARGKKAFLIERASDIRAEWLTGVKTLGLTASASAPEVLVQEVIDFCSLKLGVKKVVEDETVEEDVHFSLPYELEKLLREKAAA